MLLFDIEIEDPSGQLALGSPVCLSDASARTEQGEDLVLAPTCAVQVPTELPPSTIDAEVEAVITNAEQSNLARVEIRNAVPLARFALVIVGSDGSVLDLTALNLQENATALAPLAIRLDPGYLSGGIISASAENAGDELLASSFRVLELASVQGATWAQGE